MTTRIYGNNGVHRVSVSDHSHCSSGRIVKLEAIDDGHTHTTITFDAYWLFPLYEMLLKATAGETPAIRKVRKMLAGQVAESRRLQVQRDIGDSTGWDQSMHNHTDPDYQA